MEYVRIRELLADKKMVTISPSIKIAKSDICSEGLYPVVSQDESFILGYTNCDDKKLQTPPYIVFGDHTESIKYIDFKFVQGADGIKILKVNEECGNPRYYYYALLCFYNKTGFYERHFKLLRRTFIPDITKDEQRRIASILSAYDNLIENNNKRIRLLEQMAENLYKEWFVRFRFPGHEKVNHVDSKIGKIPSSFTVTTMNEVFEDYIGGGWGNDEKTEEFPVSASVIRGADFPNVWRYDLSTCPRRYHKTSNYKSRQLQDGDIVLEISGGTSEQPVGRTILVTQDMINRFEDGKVICASFCKLIRLKMNKISPYYFYYWMHYLYDTRIIDRYQLQSTGIINFKFEAFLKKGILMLPPKELMLSFEKQIVPLLKEINQLAMQNENLTRQRDLLLPRLMSGKLEVNVKE